MSNESSRLFETAKALMTYIRKEDVFDRAAAGGCSGLDFHQSDAFYDLIVAARDTLADVEDKLEEAATQTDTSDIQLADAFAKLSAAVKALLAHIELERAFDKVTDFGAIGFETYKSEAFIQVIQNAKEAVEGFEK
jgi:hypothetical protein